MVSGYVMIVNLNVTQIDLRRMIMKIVFNDSYKSNGFEEGVEVINKLLKPHHLKIKKTFIDDYESPDGEFAWEIKVEKI
jgi:hypothetical protein